MIMNTKLEETYTVEDFIELGKQIDDTQYCNFAILSKATDGAIEEYITRAMEGKLDG